jgi:hypothetical protein
MVKTIILISWMVNACIRISQPSAFSGTAGDNTLLLLQLLIAPLSSIWVIMSNVEKIREMKCIHCYLADLSFDVVFFFTSDLFMPDCC